jgi:deazaflavin-dependent oxidoreductase (nitroreductase family)
MEQSAITVPQRTPPAWMNSIMRIALKTPGLQRWLGKGLALLTFTGRRSGKRYSIPVSYARSGDEVLVVTKKTRSWWRNFVDRPEVTVRLAGEDHVGRASASIGDHSRAGLLRDYLSERRFDAKAYGVRIDPEGRANPDDIDELLPQVVLVDIVLS